MLHVVAAAVAAAAVAFAFAVVQNIFCEYLSLILFFCIPARSIHIILPASCQSVFLLEVYTSSYLPPSICLYISGIKCGVDSDWTNATVFVEIRYGVTSENLN